MAESTQSKGKKFRIIIIAGILILAGLIAYNVFHFWISKGPAVKAPEKIPVKTVVAGMAEMDNTLVLTADIRPRLEVNVFPKVPGKIIEKILVEKGDFVQKGAIIAIIENQSVNAQVQEARAALELARANKDVVDKDYARLANLYAEKAVARQQLDHVQAQKESAYAQVDRARAVLDQISIFQRDHRIYAPASGYISARYVDAGALSAPVQPIVRISSEKQLKIITTVTEKDFRLIKKGMKCDITTDALPGKVFSGVVSVINPSFDPASRSGEIEIHLDNQDMQLRSGMFAHLTLYLGTVKGIAVPRDVLQKTPGTGNYYVFVVKGGKASLRNIETGIAFKNIIEVTKGLEDGEEVVVTGQNRLKDGFDVVVKNKRSLSEEE